MSNIFNIHFILIINIVVATICIVYTIRTRKYLREYEADIEQACNEFNEYYKNLKKLAKDAYCNSCKFKEGCKDKCINLESFLEQWEILMNRKFDC